MEEEEEEPHPTTCTSPTPVVATGISDVFCEADVECTSRPDAEVITASSLTLFVRLARSLVVFTTLLFAFTSLVRLDHDKHDTHGSISRSGRKMYRCVEFCLSCIALYSYVPPSVYLPLQLLDSGNSATLGVGSASARCGSSCGG